MMSLVTVVLLSAILLVVHIFVQFLPAVFEQGWSWTVGSRDKDKKQHTIFAGRAARALANYRETLPIFLILAFLLVLAPVTFGSYGIFGAWLWFWARVAYLPLYLSGIPYLRTFAWLIAFAGLVLMGIPVYNMLFIAS